MELELLLTIINIICRCASGKEDCSRRRCGGVWGDANN